MKMRKTGEYCTGVLSVMVLCGSFETSFCEEFPPCPSKLTRDENGHCRPEQHKAYTEYYIWLGVISGLVVLLGVALLSCVCCKCCLIYKRRMAIANARARNNAAVSTISSHPQIGHGAHGPVNNQFRFPANPSLPRIDNRQYQMSSQAMADCDDGRYSPSQVHQHVSFANSDPRLPMYSLSIIPVFPDEPPPRYSP